MKIHSRSVLLPAVLVLVLGLGLVLWIEISDTTSETAVKEPSGKVGVESHLPSTSEEVNIAGVELDKEKEITTDFDGVSPSNSFPEFQLVDQLERNFVKTEGEPISAALIEGLLEKKEGDGLSFPLAGVNIAGTVQKKSNVDGIRQLRINLENNAGRIFLSVNQEQKLFGNLFFNGHAEAVEFSGKSESTWRARMTTVSEIVCTPEGSVYPFTSPNGESGFHEASPSPRAAELPLEVGTQIALSSLPDADYVIYLDFDGETDSSGAWTFDGSAIIAEPHYQSANDSWVTAVWQRVAEDYVPFNINVTTDREVYDNADSSKRVMSIITRTETAGPGTGGAAYIGAFGSGIPCWVFNETEYACADTISHEVGHTLGLGHHGTPSGPYYGGHGGSAETAWAPIMGAAFAGIDENVTQWSKGEYSNASSSQDDLAVILTNGFSYRIDDTGNSFATARALETSGGLIRHNGIIEQNNDIDFLFFTVLDGPIEINVDPLDINSEEGELGSNTFGGNLAVELTLYDSNGLEIETSSPTATLGASISRTLDTGIYYISITGSGRNNPLTNGFSDYGSLGQYFISGQLTTSPLVVSNLVNGITVPNGDFTPSREEGTYFDTIFIGEKPGSANTFVIRNDGTNSVTITDIRAEDGSFTLAEPFSLIVLVPGDTIEFTVIFRPATVGIITDSIVIDHYEGVAVERPLEYSVAFAGAASIYRADDNYEENDSYFEPYPLPAATNLASIEGAGIQGDNDWYEIVIPQGINALRAELTALPTAVGNIDLSLYGPGGRLLRRAATPDNNEEIEITVDPEGGTYYLVVSGDNALTGYDLFWESFVPLVVVPTGDDAYEDNNKLWDAWNIGAAKGALLSSIAGEGIQRDNDWYELPVNPNETQIDIQLTQTGLSQTPLSMQLRSAAGYILATSNSGSISYQGSRGVTSYYLLVTGDGRGETYDLTYDDSVVLTPGVGGSDDNYEDNNSFFRAYDFSGFPNVGLSTTSGLGIQKDQDWYRIVSPSGQNAVRVELATLGIVDIAIYDWRGYRVAESIGATGGTQLVARTPLHQETYYVLVSGNNQGTAYSFTWSSLFSPPGDDLFEDNDTFADAFPLFGQSGRRLSEIALEPAIQADEDWYRFPVNENSVAVGVQLLFDNSEGNLDLFLYNDAGLLIASSATFEDGERIDLVLVGTFVGEIYIQVVGPNAGTEYDLVYVVEDSDIPQDDNYEENDTFAEAFELPAFGGRLSNIDGLGISRVLDFDYYRIEVPNGATVMSVTLTFNDAIADLDLGVFDEDLNLVGLSTGTLNFKNLIFSVEEPSRSTIYIWVYYFAGISLSNQYELEWNFVMPGLSVSDIDGDLLDDNWESQFTLGQRVLSLSSDSDDDSDGFPAWAEFALNTNPVTAERPQMKTFIEDGYFCVSFNRNKKAYEMGYQYRVIESSSIGADDLEPVEVRVEDHGDFHTVVYRASQPLSSSSQSFFELEVDKPLSSED